MLFLNNDVHYLTFYKMPTENIYFLEFFVSTVLYNAIEDPM